MTCKDCEYAITMNQICEEPIQAAINMLKHLASHNAARAFAAAKCVVGAEPISLCPYSLDPSPNICNSRITPTLP
jgi:hypothetical protein